MPKCFFFFIFFVCYLFVDVAVDEKVVSLIWIKCDFFCCMKKTQNNRNEHQIIPWTLKNLCVCIAREWGSLILCTEKKIAYENIFSTNITFHYLTESWRHQTPHLHLTSQITSNEGFILCFIYVLLCIRTIKKRS